ncbi:hypothetical protein HanXRQr2_Chr13g0573021 [Helianthus annuus]|uniref:Uncharacterized protein n=1 Tax=Helianthus annuus TaxID=4232 RepID=A0A9K3H9L2_HELAN|nr:hypothetical protein HanXRQr2_Chr13g0573021 [Helianthus annuus]KAJ0847969.1 hypothetical protein HanPSC8_Chr13g0551581 [Helianthus annuus]
MLLFDTNRFLELSEDISRESSGKTLFESDLWWLLDSVRRSGNGGIERRRLRSGKCVAFFGCEEVFRVDFCGEFHYGKAW